MDNFLQIANVLVVIIGFPVTWFWFRRETAAYKKILDAIDVDKLLKRNKLVTELGEKELEYRKNEIERQAKQRIEQMEREKHESVQKLEQEIEDIMNDTVNISVDYLSELDTEERKEYVKNITGSAKNRVYKNMIEHVDQMLTEEEKELYDN